MKKLFSAFVILMATLVSLSAQTQTVTVEVKGLSCPFCAYGLEKNFKSLKGAENIKIDIEKGLLTFTLKDQKNITEKVIRQQVKEAGFTPGKITISEPEEKPNEDHE